MKKFCFLFVLIFLLSVVAQSQTSKVCVWRDGTITHSITIANIDSITFGEPPAPQLPEGMLPGVFSIGDGIYANFSQGNLIYSNSTWSFAEHQYDYGSDFGWGSSGYNGVSPGWLTDDYTYYSCMGDNDITGTNYDWGRYNAISNGGNQAGFWRTMTQGEWTYVFSKRANAAQLRSSARIINENNHALNGYVLLPDQWQLPSGLSFTPDASSYATNSYTQEQWAEMEAAGALFLRAQGFTKAGIGGGDYSRNWVGFYWSTSYYNTWSAYRFMFNESEAYVNYLARATGMSVRLIHEH